MVSSVSSTPYYSYLSQLQGTASTTPTATPAPAASAGSSSNATSQSLVSSLLGTGGYSPTVLSLLQQNSSGSFDPITSLLGGTSTDNALTQLYAGLYDTSAAASLQTANLDGTAQQTTASTAPVESPVQSLIDAQTQSTIAYNQTIQQNAANLLQNLENSDNITSLVS